MKNFTEKIILGKTGVRASRLGVSGGYGAPSAAFEMAFERGCNYFYHGSMRKKGMNDAIAHLCAKGKRSELIIVAQIYTRSLLQFRHSYNSFFKKTGLEYINVLLLGWYNHFPSKRILDECRKLKDKELIKFTAISSHKRIMFPVYEESGLFDIFHLRYNAAHRGAETKIFPKLSKKRPGTVAYTATRWGKLLNPKNMPAGEQTPRASDCYRFVLSNPNIDICMTGPKNLSEMEEALKSLDRGPMSQEEMEWMRRVGDHVRG